MAMNKNDFKEFFRGATRADYEMYKSAQRAIAIAFGFKTLSIWQQMNTMGRSPEAILIEKESQEEQFSKKLFWATGRIMHLQRETGFQFLPEEYVKLNDTIRYEWCKEFYLNSLAAAEELAAEYAN